MAKKVLNIQLDGTVTKKVGFKQIVKGEETGAAPPKKKPTKGKTPAKKGEKAKKAKKKEVLMTLNLGGFEVLIERTEDGGTGGWVHAPTCQWYYTKG